MIVHVRISALRESRWYEYVLRFALGGLATVCTGVIADKAGASWGGLFLAFPSIFCATATLVEKHERRRKEERGLAGTTRGRLAAALDAKGAAFGSVAMIAFAFSVYWLAALPVAALMAASIVWCAIATAIWKLSKQ